jgi:hypothetical protein
MSTLFDILEYITEGPTLLLFGAGPSCELGLPGWKSLTEKILIEFSKVHKENSVNRHVEQYIRDGKYTEVFEEIAKISGYGFVYDTLKTLLKDPGHTGRGYNALGQLPFCGFLTTNYDNAFVRHLTANKKVVTVHKNSKRELEQVDFDRVPTLVKLHSDLDSVETIILSKSQYELAQYSENFEYLREFLKSQVLVRRLLVVGYSMNDPDILLILKEAARILKRDVPMYAIVANASAEKIRDWDLLYNIRILPYEDHDGSHSNLLRILDLLVDYSGIRQPVAPRLTESELRDTQHLYMWHKLRFENEVESIQGALDSLVLGLVDEAQKEYVPIEELRKSARRFFSNAEKEDELLNQSLERLGRARLIDKVRESVKILPAGKAESEKHRGQFTRLCDVFRQQLILDCKEQFTSILDEKAKELAGAAFNALVDMFKERAIELFEALFREIPSGVPTSLGMFRLLNRYALALDEFVERAWLIKYCTRVLKDPRPHEIELLSYLARAFYCFQALQLDPESFSARGKLLADRMCLVDSNILIPCIADGNQMQSLYKETLRKAQDFGMKFSVLKDTVEEIERAAKWALELVRKRGERSADVLFAARGEAGYRANQFLEGYIMDTGDKRVSFGRYLAKIFGKSPDLETITEVIEKRLSIPMRKAEDLVDFEQGKVKNFRWKVKEEINRKVAESDSDRTATRIEHEAKVYTVVAMWREMKREGILERRCCFVSRGGLLSWLGKLPEVGIDFCPVVTIDGIFEMMRLAEQPEARLDFSEWIKQNYFATSASLFTSRAARKFFKPTINSAEEEYLENLESFKEVLDKKLSKSYIETIPELERPGVVRSLQMKRDEILMDTMAKEEFYTERIRDIETEKEKALKKSRYWREQARLLLRKKARKKLR